MTHRGGTKKGASKADLTTWRGSANRSKAGAVGQSKKEGNGKLKSREHKNDLEKKGNWATGGNGSYKNNEE